MEYQGTLTAKGRRFALIVSRFNEFITGKLREGAIDCLVRHEADEKEIDTFWVPGAYEIPATTQKVVATKKYDAVICLGLVMRGDTTHNQFISSEVTKGVAQVGMEADIPVSFGVVTTETLEQAIERAGTKAGNRGWEAAMAAIEMADLYTKIPS
jgi:6,7-dimethyl-8-ribityllumazine synthase